MKYVAEVTHQGQAFVFVNAYPAVLPEVSVLLDGTTLLVSTTVTDSLLRRDELLLSSVQEGLDLLLGPFEWGQERDIAFRTTTIVGQRELLSSLREGER